jgi:hypothetical protein
MGIQHLLDELTLWGLSVEIVADTFVVIRNFEIPTGKFSGEVVDIAINVPSDYPLTPPGGLFINRPLLPEGTQAVHPGIGHAPNLTGVWWYWSRPFSGGYWQMTQPRPAQRLVAHWNAVFANVE